MKNLDIANYRKFCYFRFKGPYEMSLVGELYKLSMFRGYIMLVPCLSSCSAWLTVVEVHPTVMAPHAPDSQTARCLWSKQPDHHITKQQNVRTAQPNDRLLDHPTAQRANKEWGKICWNSHTSKMRSTGEGLSWLWTWYCFQWWSFDAMWYIAWQYVCYDHFDILWQFIAFFHMSKLFLANVFLS